MVDSRDFTAITVNLQKLIEQRDILKVVTFQLVSIYKLIYFIIIDKVNEVFVSASKTSKNPKPITDRESME